MTDNLDVLLRDLALKDSGWHRIEHPVTGASAMFPDVPNHPQGSPEARAAEVRWEQGALRMIASQKPVTLAPKPAANAMTRIRRGD